MNWKESMECIAEAKRTINQADEVIKDLGKLMVGRLKIMSPYTLEKLKKELTKFNSKTKEWKD